MRTASSRGRHGKGPGRGRIARAAVAILTIVAVAGTGQSASAATPDFTPLHIVDLGTLYGFCCSQATAINERGDVVGFSAVGEDEDGPQHGFLWKSGAMTDLGTLGGEFSKPLGVNDKDDVVGYSETTTPNMFHAFLWRGGHIVDLIPGSQFSNANAINDRGEIVGDAGFPNGFGGGFLWRNGVIRWLGSGFSPTAINSRGQIAGTLEANGGSVPVLWTNGTLRRLAPEGAASGIDDKGDVVGFGIGTVSGFVWHAPSHRVTPLVSPIPDATGTNGADINNHCGVAGGISTVVALLWTGCRTPHLLPLLPADNETTGYAIAINDRGQVVGASFNLDDDGFHAVMWTP